MILQEFVNEVMSHITPTQRAAMKAATAAVPRHERMDRRIVLSIIERSSTPLEALHRIGTAWRS